MTPDPIPIPRDDLLERSLDDELALFDVERGDVHTLNPSATVVWKALGSSSTRAELIEALVDAFDISPEIASDGVETALHQLVEADLVRSA